MNNDYIKVGMADLNVASAPAVLTTLGLGSCVGIALYDPAIQLGGMAHIMLPDSTQIRNNENEAKFADTGVKALLSIMEAKGAKRHRLVAKIAGGAQMFSFPNMDESMRIGVRNTIAVKSLLELYKIPLLGEETGENYGRTIELHTETGKLVVKTIGHGIKEI
ncbi:chemotaxis protein CheD [Niameybacter massiliensis]|uniref:Probable chemoreceptor glutamine deamidase CheD n=1 Tax=Holtiella tumoricola TaxID=3018743 RepID=A0AA42DPB4_9FIRM|nr:MULTISPECIES: chemotaxis protein CheD [Lachnospirales]MDA3732612.1 chemotaxis protein CheD [Holtiella tumoricola]